MAEPEKPNYKISEDPHSKRCGFVGCQRWVKKNAHCAPCTMLKKAERVAINEWNKAVREDMAARLEDVNGGRWIGRTFRRSFESGMRQEVRR